MIVSFRESVEIDPDLRFAIFALAGRLEVYQRGMGMRDAIKALMAKAGTSWVDLLDTTYPAGLFVPTNRKRKQRRKVEAHGTTSSDGKGK